MVPAASLYQINVPPSQPEAPKVATAPSQTLSPVPTGSSTVTNDPPPQTTHTFPSQSNVSISPVVHGSPSSHAVGVGAKMV